MTPSVPGKAYFIAENHRHSASSSRSVNSYRAGPETLPASAAGLLRTLSGKATTFVLSNNSSTAPPLVAPAILRKRPPIPSARHPPQPLPEYNRAPNPSQSSPQRRWAFHG